MERRIGLKNYTGILKSLIFLNCQLPTRTKRWSNLLNYEKIVSHWIIHSSKERWENGTQVNRKDRHSLHLLLLCSWKSLWLRNNLGEINNLLWGGGKIKKVTQERSIQVDRLWFVFHDSKNVMPWTPAWLLYVLQNNMSELWMIIQDDIDDLWWKSLNSNKLLDELIAFMDYNCILENH